MDEETLSPGPEPERLPSADAFLLNMPLYEFLKINEGNVADIQQIQFYKGPLDAYCMKCKQSSIFERTKDYTAWLTPEQAVQPRIFSVRFICSRDKSHSLLFYVLVADQTMGKIGQFPSLADLHTSEIGRYRKVLGSGMYSEFSRAIGLAAHGVGVGSFVYLRRIFENLINEALSSTPQGEIDPERYSKCKMDEKILLLKDYLPSFLVENRGLYSILSKGIHSLSEEECLRYFDTVRVGIELILDEKHEQLEKRKKLEKAKSAISDLRGKIS